MRTTISTTFLAPLALVWAIASPGAAMATESDAAQLSDILQSALQDQGPDYRPRTEHFNDDGSPRYLNRLILEDSPYLLQHAHNPVNWYPWGEEAFAVARRENKPIFLSIGYATCHWCHVMERESFENEAIAEILNDHFISIKVDREQRPDVDATFMTAVQLINRSGGWPMSSFLTPDSDPFYGGTYFPPARFTQLLEQIVSAWGQERPRLIEQSKQISSIVAQQNDVRGEARQIGETQINQAVELFLQTHDEFQGGFGTAPKFPQEPVLAFLLKHAQRTGDGAALMAAHFSLQQMALGGIYDHVAGGFHRYSVDPQWLVPHFEKMLYNQANLSRNFLHAFLLTGDPAHARTVRHTLDYALREMTSAQGAFYSATDADSEGEEGTFFIRTPQEIEDVLGKPEASKALQVWGVTEAGNFEGRNILNLSKPIDETARELDLSTDQLHGAMTSWRSKLLAARAEREPPILDDKIITAWNGMLITALVQAGDSLKEPRYTDAAIKAAEFIWRENRRENGLLWRTYFNGNASIEATLSDYAFLGEAMLALFDVTRQEKWLERARLVTGAMIDHLWDSDKGAFFMGSAIAGGAALPARPKDIHDGLYQPVMR